VKVRLWTALLGACLGAGTAGADYRYVDIAVASGVDFNHRNGAEGLRYLPETYGSGVALFDADGDGMLDIYLVNAGALPALSQAAPAANRLFRRAPGGRYADATASAGVGDTGYGMGAAVGDYDNDGRPDLYITNFGANVLYRNGAPDRFIDVTGPAPILTSMATWIYSSATISTIRPRNPWYVASAIAMSEYTVTRANSAGKKTGCISTEGRRLDGLSPIERARWDWPAVLARNWA
jgi:hypothetical protein